MSVYPNPASGQFAIQLRNFTTKKADVILLSQNGTAVQRKTINLTGEMQSVVISTGNLAPGVYLIKVVSDEGIQTQQVVLK